MDFWQADGNGHYDNQGYKLRGHQLTNTQGQYYLKTVIPGGYPGRTNHIHVKVSQSAGNQNIVTTQLFFPGMRENASDNIFRESLLVTLTESNGQKIAFFNFRID